MTKIDMKKRGISSVLGTLLIVLVTTTAGVGAYVFANTMQGNLELSSGAQQTREQLSIENAKLTWDSATNHNILTMNVRNSGAVQVQIDQVYVDNIKQPSASFTPPASPTSVGQLVTLTVNQITNSTGLQILSEYTQGTAHAIKIADKSGAMFTGTVIKEQTS